MTSEDVFLATRPGMGGGWRHSYGIAFGTNVCFRCGRKLIDSELYRVSPYHPEHTATQRYRIFHVDMGCGDAKKKA